MVVPKLQPWVLREQFQPKWLAEAEAPASSSGPENGMVENAVWSCGDIYRDMGAMMLENCLCLNGIEMNQLVDFVATTFDRANLMAVELVRRVMRSNQHSHIGSHA
jgi:hypothetical protein